MEPVRDENIQTGVLTTDDFILDITTTLELVVQLISVTLFVFTASLLYYEQPIENFCVALGFFVFSLIVCYFTDATYLINDKKCSLDYSGHFLGIGFRRKVCSFDEIDSVVVDSALRKSPGSYSFSFKPFYSIVIVTNEGRVIRITDLNEENLLKCNQVCSILAKHFNAKVVHGEAGHYLSASVDPASQEVKISLQSRKWRLHWILKCLCIIPVALLIIHGRDNWSLPDQLSFLESTGDIDIYESFDDLVKILRQLVE